MAEKFMTVTWAGSETADGYELYEQNQKGSNLLVSVFDPTLNSVEVPIRGHTENTFFAVPFRMKKAKREYEEVVQAEVQMKFLSKRNILQEIQASYTVEPPKMKKAEIMKEGVYVSWTEMEGISQYRVFRRKKKEQWGRLRDVSNAYFLDKSAESGQLYQYTVRCLNEDRTTYLSDYDKAGTWVRYIPDPNIERTRL